jgi:hypothetical protein
MAVLICWSFLHLFFDLERDLLRRRAIATQSHWRNG